MTSSSSFTQAPSIRLAVLLLAAGEGSRLGAYPKALLRKDGQTLLRGFSRAIQQFTPTQYVVVTGYHAEVIEAEIEKLNSFLLQPIKTVKNLAPEKGQASSVRLGLESLQEGFDVLLVALSDQPEIGVREIKELLDAFDRRESGEEIILPMVAGRRGNPVLFSRKAISDVLEIPGMVCRKYMDTRPEKVRVMPTSNLAFVMDVDMPEDIQKHKLSLN